MRCQPGAATPLDVKKDTSVNIRLTSELRAELQRLADEDGRKLSAYIERLLQLHVRADSKEAELRRALMDRMQSK